MKRSLLAVSVASALLVGCGGGGDSQPATEHTGESTFKLSGSALDSDYISKAKVCLDFDILQSCESGLTTQTDENGNFEFTVPQKYHEQLSHAVVTVEIGNDSVPSVSQKSSSEADKANYQTLIALSSDLQSVYVSPFTTQVADKVALKGVLAGSDMEAVVTQVIPEIKEMNDMSTVSDKVLFGNYLGMQNEVVALMVAKAEQNKQWRKRALEIKKALKSDPAYSGWQIIKPVVWNTHQYAYQTGEYIERYEEYVYLSKKQNGNTIERYEGQQWLLDGAGQPDLSAKLLNYHEDKVWTDKEVSTHSYWEFDYNQDKVFGLQGEKIAIGKYKVNEQGNLAISQLELYNEGDPSVEGGYSQKRDFCSNFDLSAELTKYKNGETLDRCVDMVQLREFDNYRDKDKRIVSTDSMAEYKKPNDDISQSITTDFIAYYENREFYWTLDGGQGTNIYKDWEAKSKSSFDLAQSPYNYVRKDYVDADGYIHSSVETPIWTSSSQEAGVKASTIKLLGQWNPVRWGNTTPGFASEMFDESDSSETYRVLISPLNNSVRWDANRQGNVWLNLPFLGENNQPVPVTKVSQTWDKSNKVMTASAEFLPIVGHEDHDLTSDQGPTEPVSVYTSVQYSGILQGIDIAQQTVKVGESVYLQSTPAFTKSYFDKEAKWSVSSPDMPTQLMELLFNKGINFRFSANTSINDTELDESFCEHKRIENVEMALVHNMGGDLVVTTYCDDGQVDDLFGKSQNIPGQYVLRMSEQLNSDGMLKADLLMWKKGENIYQDQATSYKLEFTLAK